MPIRSFQLSDAISNVVAALRHDGAVILHGLVAPEVTGAVAAELRPYFDTEGATPQNDFNGYKTRLRQEENQYLTVPREVADGLPPHIRRLMGYQGHGRLLGWYPDNPDGY